jgi:ribosome-associated translation inhibitor RaiA
MSDPTNSSTDILAERLRLSGGFSAEDRDHVLDILAPLGKRLARWRPEDVDLELTIKNRGGLEQKVTLEAWLPRWPSLVASSADRDLHRALINVRQEMIRQIEDEKAKHDPRKAHDLRRGRP